MNAKSLAVPAFFLLFATAALPALADELIRFKSGYEMMVVSHREQGGMIIVTLEGGGEVGFPKELIEELEQGKPSHRTENSPLFNSVWSRVNVDQFVAPLSELPSRFLARGVTNAEGVTIGYSRGDQPMQRFSGGPTGPVTAGGKVGIDVRSRGSIRDRNLPAAEGNDAAQPGAGASETPTIKMLDTKDE